MVFTIRASFHLIQVGEAFQKQKWTAPRQAAEYQGMINSILTQQAAGN